MQIKNLKMVNKLPIICQFDLTFVKIGLTLRELRVMETNGKKWIAFPSRQYEAEGKKKYFAYIGIEKERQEAFEKKVMELLLPFLTQQPPTSSHSDDECPF